jgi:hypothetical protein
MPDITLIMPAVLFKTPDSRVKSGAEMRYDVGQSVVTNLHCRDDDGNELPEMDPIDNVDFHLIAYGGGGIKGYELHSSTPIIVKVEAFDYEERMRDIELRLQGIAHTIRVLLGLEPGQIGITYHPVRQKPSKCWTKV